MITTRCPEKRPIFAKPFIFSSIFVLIKFTANGDAHALTTSNWKKPMLRITTQKKRGKTLLSIEGRLAGPLVGTLEQCWRELRAAAPGEKLHLNLCGVSFIDAAGKMLLKEIHRQGGELIAEGCLNQAIVDELVKSA